MISRDKMLTTDGRPITQSLFLEMGYTEHAVYTLKDYDHEHNGKIYLSLKRLYLELEDATEYEFANKYLLGWKHWQRMVENKGLTPHIHEWREELELKLRARATKQMMDLANQGSFQASKWLSDRGWDTRGAGRPSKAEKERNARLDDRVKDEYGADVLRLFANQG